MPCNQIPKPFQAWRPWLSWFNDSLQPNIADLMLQLNPLLGPVKESQWHDQQLLSGLGDLHKRGSYANLLASEWLIAQEEPDEFIRRAVSYEHLFLAPTQEKSKANGVIIALFDSGILQLGVSRLVHLILMLLLDIRSHAQGSQFYWGVIQSSPKLKLFQNVNDLKLLLNTRTTKLVDNNHLDEWHNYIQQAKLNYDECWLIGTNHQKIDLVTHQVNIEKSIEDYNKLLVKMTSNMMTKCCQLTLPNEIICAKMVLGQFMFTGHYAEIVKKSIVPINVNFKPLISANGNRILTYNGDNTHIYFVNLSDLMKVKNICHIHHYHLNYPVLGFDLLGKHVVALIQDNKTFFIWQPNRPRIEIAEVIHVDKNNVVIALLWLFNGHGTDILFVDAENKLYALSFLPKSQEKITKIYKIAENVIALFKLSDQQALYLYNNDKQQLLINGYNINCHFFYCLTTLPNLSNQQFFITAESLWLQGFGRLAIGQAQEWQIYTAEHDYQRVAIPNEWQVFGLYYDNKTNRTDFLVINQDRKQVALFDYSNNKMDVCFRSPNKIINYSYNSLAQSFTVTTNMGELIVYSFVSQSARLRLYKAN